MSDYLIINTDKTEVNKSSQTFSGCKQDLFVIETMKHKRNGFYVDIGSAHCYDNNNSFLLEKNYNWKGICVEFESRYNSSYSMRNCKYYNSDALSLDYSMLFTNNELPNIIDYISLDIDDLTTELLSKIPFNNYKFKIITIEHDLYLNGEKDRNEQRKILISKGYHLLFGDVYVEMANFDKEKPFEDWWINPEFFEKEFIEKSTQSLLYPSEAIQIVKENI